MDSTDTAHMLVDYRVGIAHVLTYGSIDLARMLIC